MDIVGFMVGGYEVGEQIFCFGEFSCIGYSSCSCSCSGFVGEKKKMKEKKEYIC